MSKTVWGDFGKDAKELSRPPGPACRVALLLASLDAPARVSLQAALSDPHLSNTGILKALEKRLAEPDVPTLYALGRHRREQCSCRRTK